MTPDDTADPWADHDSGPYCRHWAEFGTCELKCAACGHRCEEHARSLGDVDLGCEEPGCECKAWEDPAA